MELRRIITKRYISQMIRGGILFVKVVVGLMVLTPVLLLNKLTKRFKYEVDKLGVYGRLRVYRE